MTDFASELQLLQLQMSHKTRLEAMLKELRSQQTILDRKVENLRQVKLEEQKDVERLEGRSLAAFFYYVAGKREQQLDIERREAYVARVKYDAALREQEAILHDIQEAEADLLALGDLNARYKQLLESKSDAIRAAGSPWADALIEKEQSLAFLREQEKALLEALDVGRTAISITDAILDKLGSAEDWGTFDILSGGILADVVKHDQLDEAQSLIESLQVQLQRFNKELADVTIRRDLQVSIDGILRFADCFLDNLLTDIAVLEKIQQARSQVTETRDQILSILRKLTDSLESASHLLSREEEALDKLILNTEVTA